MRQTADERRTTVLRAAMAEFAKGGYAGTSTEAIAARAGISQPYLFRLFGTKRDLFIATMGLMHARIEAAFRAAGGRPPGIEAMAAMGDAYKELLGERDLLLVQLHAFAASEDEEIRRAAREGFRHLWDVVAELTGLPDEDPGLLRPGDAAQRDGRHRRRRPRRVLGPGLPARSRAVLRPPPTADALTQSPTHHRREETVVPDTKVVISH